MPPGLERTKAERDLARQERDYWIEVYRHLVWYCASLERRLGLEPARDGYHWVLEKSEEELKAL